ncbi:chemotaxis protein CheW [Virgibacillus sp. L01]|uniref:chemotaxis protein CheW n=1 Tax=Virgibacillus sp. L01 TaxID=3457429 RepID=UPI003FD3DC3F
MDEFLKVIVFQLDEQQYGVDIQEVLSIEKLQHITEVPQTSDFIKGVINLRGEITPVIDLKERLRIGETRRTGETRVLIASMNNVQVGLIVDAASDVVDIDPNVIEQASQIVNGVKESFLKGVAKLENRLLVLLDLEHVFNFDEINEVKEIAED